MPQTDRIEFPGGSGDLLAAKLDRPPGRPRAWALFAHCFTCSKDFVASRRLAQALAERGIGVLRFDFTGLGSSAGDFANTNFSSSVEDLVRAAEWLRRNHEAPRILVGHSLGGAAVLAAAGRIPEAVAVATIGAPADPEHVAGMLAEQRDEIEARGEAEVLLAGRSFRIRKQFLDDLAASKLEDLADLNKALLVMHSPVDNVVGIENASRIFLAARHPKSFISLDGADHLLTRPADAAWTADLVAAWAARFLPAEPEAERPEDDGEVLVQETGEGTYANVVRVGPHVLAADEPPSVGGNDTGPSPYGYLLASLGSCTSMTVRMYANRKGWPLERVGVRLRHEKIHARDCEACETETGKIDRIEREITLEGALDAEQRQRLLEIADRCPVHRTLHSEVAVETHASAAR